MTRLSFFLKNMDSNILHSISFVGPSGNARRGYDEDLMADDEFWGNNLAGHHFY